MARRRKFYYRYIESTGRYTIYLSGGRHLANVMTFANVTDYLDGFTRTKGGYILAPKPVTKKESAPMPSETGPVAKADQAAAADLMAAICIVAYQGDTIDIFRFVSVLDAPGLLEFTIKAQQARDAALTQADAMWWAQQVTRAQQEYADLATEYLDLTPSSVLELELGLEALAITTYPGVDALTWAVKQWVKTLTTASTEGLEAVGMTVRLAPEHASTLLVAGFIGSGAL